MKDQHHHHHHHQRLTGAEIVCECLIRQGVEVMFGIPGGTALPLYDTFTKYPQLRHVLVRHEQGAAHAADGYARATGKAGVCVATSGPGSTNLVTGIATAMLDSVPVVAITANVPNAMLGRDAFQEVDIQGITIPITKHNYLVQSPDEIAYTIAEAFHLATTGRPGPVHIDIPKDVLQNKADFRYPKEVRPRGYRPTVQGHPGQIKKAAKLIAEAERPVIIAGHGVIISHAYEELRGLAERCEIPVITTLLGISAFPEQHRLALGMVGMHGHAWSNKATCETDLVIALGIRFDDRSCGRFSGFAPKAKIIHVDIDPAEIEKNVPAAVPIVGDLRNVLKVLVDLVPEKRHPEWLARITEWRRQYPTTYPNGEPDGIPHEGGLLPQEVITQLSRVTRGEATVVSDVGQHQMWVAQYYGFARPNTHISSGGLGTMGFAVPAAVGVQVARPGELVWAVCGDGGFQMTMQELATIAAERLPVKIALINNRYLGMVRQWQELFYERRYSATYLGHPDFVKLAEAFHIRGVRVNSREEVRPAIEQAIGHEGPALIEFVVEPEENCYPMVAPGTTNADIITDPRLERMGTRKEVLV